MPSKPTVPDFDTLMHMFQQDPEDYEMFRKRLLDEAIAESPVQYQKNLQYILMRIEIARQTATTPLEALAYATRLMQESLEELNDALDCLQHELTGLQSLLVLERIMSHSQGRPPQPESGGKFGT